MNKVKKSILFVVAVFALSLVGITRIGVDALHPVKEPSTHFVYRPDGRNLTKPYAWEDIKVNWLSNLFFLLIIGFISLWLVRIYRLAQPWHHKR